MRHSIWRMLIGFSVSIATLISTQHHGLAERQHPYLSAASVCIDLSVKDHISGPALTTLREEAARIWLRHGVELTWTYPAPARCDTVVPVMFDDDKVRELSGARSDALGLTEFFGLSRKIYMSAVRAFAMVGQIRGRTSPMETIGERDYRLGTLMGRALAHELGHVLLSTLEHSATGLMRPVFAARDALSVDASATDLTPVAAERLAARFSLIPLDDPRARQAGRTRALISADSGHPHDSRDAVAPIRFIRAAYAGPWHEFAASAGAPSHPQGHATQRGAVPDDPPAARSRAARPCPFHAVALVIRAVAPFIRTATATQLHGFLLSACRTRNIGMTSHDPRRRSFDSGGPERFSFFFRSSSGQAARSCSTIVARGAP